MILLRVMIVLSIATLGGERIMAKKTRPFASVPVSEGIPRSMQLWKHFGEIMYLFA